MELVKKDNALYINGVKICDCMDPGILKPGSYRLEFTYSPKFKRELPLVYNSEFPASRSFRIHQGNWMKDSRGCILVGRKVSDGVLADSLKTLEYLIILLKLNKIETLIIES